MDELRDSVVSGRFNTVSSLVSGEAAGDPEGLGEKEEIKGVEGGRTQER